jgi:hypothetical protein
LQAARPVGLATGVLDAEAHFLMSLDIGGGGIPS